MEMLGGGAGVKSQCRTPDIMSDAAHVMLCKDSRSCTGNFCIDDEVLKEAGVTDLEKYACEPGAYLHFSTVYFRLQMTVGPLLSMRHGYCLLGE